MPNLDVHIDDKLYEEINRLALKHYGDDSEESRQRVIETALKMRIFWSHSVKKGQEETDEAVTSWEFPESSVGRGNTENIQNFLFWR
jgi:hypothetical protein